MGAYTASHKSVSMDILLSRAIAQWSNMLLPLVFLCFTIAHLRVEKFVKFFLCWLVQTMNPLFQVEGVIVLRV